MVKVYSYSALIKRLGVSEHSVRYARRRAGAQASNCPTCGFGPVWTEEEAAKIEVQLAARKHHGPKTALHEEAAA